MQSGSVYELEHRIVRPDGSVRWVYDRAHAHLDENGDLLRYVGATLDITERKQAEAALLESEAKHASQQERRRLARDLHDSVTQALFAANLKAEALTFVPDLDSRATTLAEDTRRLSRGALAQMRTLLLELRGDLVEDIPLRQLLRQLVEAAEGLTRTEISLQLDGEATLPGDVHVTVYRVVQEALNNVAKHAGAAHAEVQLRLGDVGLHLVVRDDGSGFDAEQVAPGHMGLRSMQERASELGALLTVESEAGHGTQVTLQWTADAGQEVVG